METSNALCNLISGTSLVVLLTMLMGALVLASWRKLNRQFSRSGLIVFLICAGIATVEAQKTLYVDINKSPESDDFRTIQEAIDYVGGKRSDAVDIVIKPGVYPPVDLTHFYFEGVTVLTPSFSVGSALGPGSVIIDGGGVTNAITMGNSDWGPLSMWNGLVLSNAVCGADGGGFFRCAAVDCKIGFKNSYLTQCLSYGNSLCGVQDSYVWASLVANNGGEISLDDPDICAGVQSCFTQGTIVWGNMRNGVISNWSGGGSSYSCMAPLQSGEGNICNDPMFVDATHGDFHLQMGSPCINALLYMAGYSDSKDFDGNPRTQRGVPDIGPYEYQPTNETQTITAPVPVEFAWIDEKCPDLLASVGGNYDKAVLLKSANPIDISLPESVRSYYSIWESYVADLNPTDSNATFCATIAITNGVPCVKGSPESPNRRYTILGKQSITDEVWSASCLDPHFFKVKVDLK